MTREEFEALAAEAIKQLPVRFRELLSNVVIITRDRPTRAQEARFGPGLLGLYEGIPLAERGQAYSGAMPDKITLFRENLEREGRGNVAARVRHTLLHELAHHFGIGDEELRKKGLY